MSNVLSKSTGSDSINLAPSTSDASAASSSASQATQDLVNGNCEYHQVADRLRQGIERFGNDESIYTVEELNAILKQNMKSLHEQQLELDAIQYKNVDLFPVGSEERELAEYSNALNENLRSKTKDLMNLLIQNRILTLEILSSKMRAEEYLARAKKNLQEFQKNAHTCTCLKRD